MVLLKPDCDGNKNLFSSNDNGGDYGDGDDHEPLSVESLCVNCKENVSLICLSFIISIYLLRFSSVLYFTWFHIPSII